MSSPIRKMSWSRSISSSSASRRAARNSVSGIAVHLPFVRVQVAVQLVYGGVGALVRETHDLVHLRVDTVLALFQFLRGCDSGLLELVLEQDHRVIVPPLLLLFVGPVFVGVHHGVPPEAVVDRLDEARL